MNPKKMMIHEVAKLTGITIRALHYYDEIGLLEPTKADKTKYRLYSENDLEKLQQILFYREAGFSLKEIKALLSAPVYNRREALERHLELLNLRKKKIEELICLVNDTLAGKSDYSFTAFSNAEVSALQEKYRNEVIERWGSTHEYQEFSSFFQPEPKKREIGSGMIFLYIHKMSLNDWRNIRRKHLLYLPFNPLLQSGRSIYLKTSIPVRMLC